MQNAAWYMRAGFRRRAILSVPAQWARALFDDSSGTLAQKYYHT